MSSEKNAQEYIDHINKMATRYEEIKNFNGKSLWDIEALNYLKQRTTLSAYAQVERFIARVSFDFSLFPHPDNTYRFVMTPLESRSIGGNTGITLWVRNIYAVIHKSDTRPQIGSLTDKRGFWKDTDTCWVRSIGLATYEIDASSHPFFDMTLRRGLRGEYTHVSQGCMPMEN